MAMKNQEKIKVVHTKDMIIKNISEECNKDKKIVRSIYNALENYITEHLSSADIDTDISIRLFEGITIDSEFIPEKTNVNNLTGKIITSKSKIRPKANITRNYREKLTAYNK